LMVPKVKGAMVIKGCVPAVPCDRFSDAGWENVSANVPEEMELSIFLNQQELLTVQCTPNKLNYLVLGFLYNEGVISSLSDVASMRACDDEAEVDVRLINAEFEMPTKRTITSGCTGGVAFDTDAQAVDSNLVVKPEEILALMKQFLKKMELYRLCGGVHASALCTTNDVVVVSEDIGRHNTLDKIQGECLMMGISTKDTILISTGRISSEMLKKAARMQVPVVVSRTSPTDRSVDLAKELGITVVGYVKANRLLAYSHPERLGR